VAEKNGEGKKQRRKRTQKGTHTLFRPTILVAMFFTPDFLQQS
jgi:hypothetical protein